MVELFAQNIIESGKIYLDSPTNTPNMPTWRRVDSAAPHILKEIILQYYQIKKINNL